MRVLPLLGLLATGAQAQVLHAPGESLTWERVGDAPVYPYAAALAFDGAGTLYAAEFSFAYRLDLSGGFPGVWVLTYDGLVGDTMVGLGADTLVASTGGRTSRSTDGGETWDIVYDEGSHRNFGLHEASVGTPLVGTLFLASYPITVSEDRGATWEERGTFPDFAAGPHAFATLSSGRVVGGGWWGAAYSDDEGWTWTLSSLWGYLRYAMDALAVVESPEGSERVLVAGGDATQPYVRVWYSDDEGETWAPPRGYPLPEPLGNGDYSHGIWGLGGTRALVVLLLGSVYGTEDGGETWAVVGQVPDISLDDRVFVKSSLVGSDGRLYVTLSRGRSENSWVWRTVQRVAAPVTNEPEPVEETSAKLEVTPNPVLDVARAVFTLADASWARLSVHDVLGREVAVLVDQAMPAGQHEVVLDGSSLPAGTYLVRLEAGGEVHTRPVTVLR